MKKRKNIRENIGKHAARLVLALLMMLSASSPVFAGTWLQGEGENAGKWWYSTSDDHSTWYADDWQWIDGNGDGTAECYYFDQNGYMLADTVTPDGYQVTADGAWAQDGVVQTRIQEADGAAAVNIDLEEAVPVSSSTNGVFDLKKNGNPTGEKYQVTMLSDGGFLVEPVSPKKGGKLERMVMKKLQFDIGMGAQLYEYRGSDYHVTGQFWMSNVIFIDIWHGDVYDDYSLVKPIS